MSTAIWPPISPEDLLREEEDSLAAELQWLLTELQDTLHSLKAGLEECAELLAPKEPGSTLVLSSLRSESLKGFVTRMGTRIVKGDVYLRLPHLPPPKGASTYKLSISSDPQASTLVLKQLTSVRNLINTCLDIVDVSTWTGDSHNANFITGQLRLLADNMAEAKQALKGGPEIQKEWLNDPVDETIFSPPLPSNLSFHLSIADAGLLLQIRVVEPSSVAAINDSSYSGFSIRRQLISALGGTRTPTHDEAEEMFMYKGQEVRVKEKVRVESQDPSLMAAMAKLSALEHTVGLSRRALDIVMGKGMEE